MANVPAGSQPVYGTRKNGSPYVKGYTIGGTYLSRRQVDKVYGRYEGTGLTPERQQRQNRDQGTRGAPAPKSTRATSQPRQQKPKAPAGPRYRDRSGRFAPRPEERKVKANYTMAEFEVPPDLEAEVPSWPNYPPAINYIKQLPNNAQVWVMATGKISPKYKDPYNTHGWKTVLTINDKPDALRKPWSLGIFEEIYMIRVLWYPSKGEPE